MCMIYFFLSIPSLIWDYSYLSHQMHSDMWGSANQTIKSNSSPRDVDWSKINWPHGCLKARRKQLHGVYQDFPHKICQFSSLKSVEQ